jgi:hypothetical protein
MTLDCYGVFWDIALANLLEFLMIIYVVVATVSECNEAKAAL